MADERTVIPLVQQILGSGERDDGRISEVIRREIECFRNPTDHHAVWWNFRAWAAAEGWTDGERKCVTGLAALLRQEHPYGTDWTLVSRADVFDRNEDGELAVFLAAMAWGFGDRGYGWDRTIKMLRAADRVHEGGVGHVVQAMRVAWDLGGASEIFQSWSRRGDSKVPGLNTAFASKLAYFTCFDRRSGRGPLIADQNTAWAVFVLADIERSLNAPGQYAKYVSWAEDLATRLDCRADEVERALFVLGPDVKQIWQRLQRDSA